MLAFADRLPLSILLSVTDFLFVKLSCGEKELGSRRSFAI